MNKQVERVSVDTTYDVSVLGVGSMGASTCYHLAKQGYTLLGLEQFDIPHELGSHAGQSRIIRKAFGEASDYMPLLERAYFNWHTLEAETGSLRTGFSPRNARAQKNPVVSDKVSLSKAPPLGLEPRRLKP
ncbi:MAG: FAD-dependent oxidoreductase [Maribacter sp.]